MNRKKTGVHFAVFALVALCVSSTFAAAPTISVFAPTSGVLYSTVTITGTNFVAPMTVSFNGVASTSVTVVNSTTAKATLPPTASTGVITVGTSGGSANSASAFTVLPGVLVSPAVGPPTTVTRIYFSGFSAYEPVDFYLDTGDIALTSASATGAGNPPVTIPATARPGVHFVTAVGRRSLNSAQANFTVQTNWPQYGFAPNLKGKNRYENVLSAATAGDLDEAWRTPEFVNMDCAPAVVNGTVYADFFDGTIRAFNETTGAQLWSYATGFAGGVNLMISSPAVSNGIVYVGSDDGFLYALDAVVGVLKWRYRTGAEVEGSPNVFNGIVYFGSADGNVYALNATTGASIWSFSAGAPVGSCPMVANGVVYVGSDTRGTDGNGLYALNASTGALIWSFAGVTSSPVIVGGLICAGSNGVIYALHASTGSVAWEYDTGTVAVIGDSPAAVGGSLFFGASDGTFYSVDSSGALRWKTALQGRVNSAVCAGNGLVYASNGSDTFALDENSGAVVATLPVGTFDGGPAVADGAVFTGDYNDGVLTRYTLNALQSGYVALRPDPMQLRPHHLR